MSNHRPGGGAASNKVVTPSVRTGAPAGGVRPGYAGQIGTALGNRAMEGVRADRAAEPMRGPAPYAARLGNEVAGNVGKGGPGTGRIVHASGSQMQHGPATAAVNKPSLPKDIMSHYGPETHWGRR